MLSWSSSPDSLLGVPPGKHFVVLPRRPFQAALAGLALYDSVSLHQKLAVVATRGLLRCGLAGVLRLRYEAPLPAQEWWRGWISEIAEPVLGRVECAAFRLLGDREAEPPRVTTILFDRDGGAIGFAKIWRRATTENTLREPMCSWNQMLGVLESLGNEPAKSFKTPRLLASGTYGGRFYIIQEVIPDSVHHSFTDHAATLHAIVDELQQRLDRSVGRGDWPSSFVPVHGAMTPMNLRRTRDSTVWLLDWDKVGCAPRLTDELSYWLTGAARRPWPVGGEAARILSQLRARGDDQDVEAALSWRCATRPVEALAKEQAIRTRMMREIASGSIVASRI